MNVRCTQCGAEVPVPADVRLVQCAFCDTALVVDGDGTLFREVMLPTVKLKEAVHHLRRFMAGTETIADLDKKARIGTPELVYFPFWAFSIATDAGERIVLEPAAPSFLQGLQGMDLPPGNSHIWTAGITGAVPVVEPEVPLATARNWLTERLGKMREKRTVLYHLPLYRISYTYGGKKYSAAVEGVSGQVLPADFPAKAETPYFLVAAAAIAVFSIEGLVITNLLFKAVIFAISAVPLFLLAWLTSRKV
ncbi:MAG: hypothetical protein K8R59_02110 [Thermoanaerobaculales bacterium]|nr:hypothetical protein [Thermoanaerobaculales bacterium]